MFRRHHPPPLPSPSCPRTRAGTRLQVIDFEAMPVGWTREKFVPACDQGDFSMEVHKVGYMEVRIQCRDQIRVLALRLTTGKKKTVFDKWVPPGAQANKCLEHISKKSISNGTLDNTANSSNQHKFFEPHNQSSTVNIDFSPPCFLCWRPEIARVKNSWDSWKYLRQLRIVEIVENGWDSWKYLRYLAAIFDESFD